MDRCAGCQRGLHRGSRQDSGAYEGTYGPTRCKVKTGVIMKWITREHPKIDRIACPWLLLRFIDADAEFHFVPADQVIAMANAIGATPYDIPGVELTHVGERCSFDAFIDKYRLDDSGLTPLAIIVRGPDTSRLDFAPHSASLYAISLWLSATFPDD